MWNYFSTVFFSLDNSSIIGYKGVSRMILLRSSTVEQSAVNRLVTGSNPVGGVFF